jgi:hypothetical protein
MPDEQASQDSEHGAANEVCFEVRGNPPLKNETISMFNATHGQADRIRALLQAAQRACQEQEFVQIVEGGVALDVIARSPTGDGANIIGGIADVLEDKSGRGIAIEHLGDLAAVWIYRNDKQLKQISYREESGEHSYTVTVRAL